MQKANCILEAHDRYTSREVSSVSCFLFLYILTFGKKLEKQSRILTVIKDRGTHHVSLYSKSLCLKNGCTICTIVQYITMESWRYPKLYNIIKPNDSLHEKHTLRCFSEWLNKYPYRKDKWVQNLVTVTNKKLIMVRIQSVLTIDCMNLDIKSVLYFPTRCAEWSTHVFSRCPSFKL